LKLLRKDNDHATAFDTVHRRRRHADRSCLVVALRRPSARVPCPAWLGWILDPPVPQYDAASSVLLDRLDLAPGMQVLDMGCGVGSLTVPAALRVGATGAVVAIDIQTEMLQRARAKAEAAELTNTRFVHAGEGKLECNRFDRVLLVMVLGETVDREAALAKIAAALKPGGMLLMMEILIDPHYQTRRTVRKPANRAGLREQRCWGNLLLFTMAFVKPKND
jgi:cyclopropane fatty-acyl-phospholipid synthase-like methyltransferase